MNHLFIIPTRSLEREGKIVRKDLTISVYPVELSAQLNAQLEGHLKARVIQSPVWRKCTARVVAIASPGKLPRTPFAMVSSRHWRHRNPTGYSQEATIARPG